MEGIKFNQVMMIVLDGFGVASPYEGNAIYLAKPQNFDYLINNFPATTLQASGPAVGLPWGERGNSEVGHLNLGAGRVVSQDLPRINLEIASGNFFKNPAFIAAADHAKKNNSKLHLAGLFSSGGVHSLDEHLFALLGLAADRGLKEVYIHLFTDGRDTAPKVALGDLDKLASYIQELKAGKIATVAGRFYGMDRGGHWELTEKVYRAMVFGEGEFYSSAREALEANYEKQIYDETIPPTVVSSGGKPTAAVADGDAVVFFNFRADRMQQLTRAFADPAFNKFSKKYPYLQNMFYATMTFYGADLPVVVAYPRTMIEKGLAEVLSFHNLSQTHLAESEKYAHVTSFFNGGRQDAFPREEREIVSSPAAYEKRYQDVPEMSVEKLTERITQKLRDGTNFVLANIANPDMVGHTGNREAAILAVKAVDKMLGLVREACLARKACLIVTADHGNIEQLVDIRTGAIDKEHSQNPVPFILVASGFELKTPKTKGYLELPPISPEGVLADVAPTILELFGLPKPSEMTGISLLPMLILKNQ